MEIKSSSDINIDDFKSSDECQKIIEQIVRIIDKITLDLNQNPTTYSNRSIPYSSWKIKAEKAKKEFSALLTALYTKKRYLRKKEKEETQKNGQSKIDKIFRSLVRRELGQKKFEDLIKEAELLYRLHDEK